MPFCGPIVTQDFRTIVRYSLVWPEMAFFSDDAIEKKYIRRLIEGKTTSIK